MRVRVTFVLSLSLAYFSLCESAMAKSVANDFNLVGLGFKLGFGFASRLGSGLGQTLGASLSHVAPQCAWRIAA